MPLASTAFPQPFVSSPSLRSRWGRPPSDVPAPSEPTASAPPPSAGLGALLQVRPRGLQARGRPRPPLLVQTPRHLPQQSDGDAQQQHADDPPVPQDHPGEHAPPRHVCAGEEGQGPSLPPLPLPLVPSPPPPRPFSSPSLLCPPAPQPPPSLGFLSSPCHVPPSLPLRSFPLSPPHPNIPVRPRRG